MLKVGQAHCWQLLLLLLLPAAAAEILCNLRRLRKDLDASLYALLQAGSNNSRNNSSSNNKTRSTATKKKLLHTSAHFSFSLSAS